MRGCWHFNLQKYLSRIFYIVKMAPLTPIILGQADVHNLLCSLSLDNILSKMLPALVDILRASSMSLETRQPRRIALSSARGATTLFMPYSTADALAVKIVTVSPSTPVKGIWTQLSPTGALEGLVNAEELTAFRTALASISLLMRRQVQGIYCHKAVIFGTGNIAMWTARLLFLVLGTYLKDLRMVGRQTAVVTEAKARYAGVTVTQALGSAEPGFSLVAVLSDVDAVFCCTPATEPLFEQHHILPNGMVEKSVYISAIGSYKPSLIELPPALLRRPGVKVVVDSREACMVESGEVIASGIAMNSMIELGEMLPDDHVGGVVVWKCVGLACMDMAIGKEILELARQRSIGVLLPDFE